ncbi:5658_t:CDS:2 [Cetraspora pellucida]|uniref:5658_t:CDS:1 n=1 Tax=Cetraspora pellucida TaxID=1433469 RepID=A0ACA9MNF6_9GLOM|nr:5658_t:CDS:2 [Cetraspora pellucida]
MCVPTKKLVVKIAFLWMFGSTGQIALVINYLTVSIALFGLIAFYCGYGCWGILGSYQGFIFYQLFGSFMKVYFTKIIVDYIKLVELKQQNVQTPGRVEASNTTNNYVVNRL